MENLNGKRVVLVGGAGFIGHNLALTLQKAGAEVAIVDGLQVNNYLALLSDDSEVPYRDFYLNIVNQRIQLLRKAQIPLYVQDARDYHALGKVFKNLQPQVLVQLAAVAHANESNKNPYSTFDHSLRTLENALDHAKDRIEHFIYFSSSMVYGNFKNGEVFEDTPCEPLGIYGALKLSGEKMVIAYNQVFDLPYTIVRPSALYGPRCISRRVGQVFIENAIRGLDISINGDGEDRLDFTYIDDLSQGISKIIQNEKAKNEIFNITYGSSRSVNDMVAILEKHWPDLEVKRKHRDKLMPKRGTLSIDKARKLIGYSPEFALENGFVEYIEWYKDAVQSAVA